jgi:hypothetical protein
MKIDKRKSLIMTSVVVLIAVLGVAILVTYYEAPKGEEEVFTPENRDTNGFPYGAPPFNFTAPEGDFNFTVPEDRFNQPFPDGHNFTFPEGDFNFTIPDDGFNAPFPEGGFNATFPGDGFDGGHSPFMGNLTDEQRTILDEKMQELTESGATQEDIIAAMWELMEEFGIQDPPE